MRSLSAGLSQVLAIQNDAVNASVVTIARTAFMHQTYILHALCGLLHVTWRRPGCLCCVHSIGHCNVRQRQHRVLHPARRCVTTPYTCLYDGLLVKPRAEIHQRTHQIFWNSGRSHAERSSVRAKPKSKMAYAACNGDGGFHLHMAHCR